MDAMKTLRNLALWIMHRDAERLGLHLLTEEEFAGIWATSHQTSWSEGYNKGKAAGYSAGYSRAVCEVGSRRDTKGRFAKK
jgi:hypothetical protein